MSGQLREPGLLQREGSGVLRLELEASRAPGGKARRTMVISNESWKSQLANMESLQSHSKSR